ncbi:hypothetical protein GCM10007939_21770 [Amylibacter marinus]|uniref:COQ9 C-terminal domain-containing protein n=1 Tax=Amylibacter marinus TaxID=1475483 RepID=A0ABQ5VXT3_9RHOB|nr:COQ9 family protein [Amylibacter marinus]GLQ35893.1 hypothetical protein GCM10007939_21770 [Amylibacter marinus]
MPQDRKSEADHIEIARAALLGAILPHVEFDGWGANALQFAISDSGVDAGLAMQAAPRGAIDLAVAFHRTGDVDMVAGFQGTDITNLKYREKVALLIRLRLQAAKSHPEAVRRAASLFALPQNMAEGSQLIWDTSDAIWNALGDTSRDANWYTKRATLSAVYSTTVLYWLGDNSTDYADTWAFLDRRIENVMQFERVKSSVMKSPLGNGLGAIMERFSKPDSTFKSNFPGYTR